MPLLSRSRSSIVSCRLPAHRISPIGVASLGLTRKSSALKEHGLNLILQRARVPALHAAHFRIEFATKSILYRQQQGKVRPSQLSQQCCDNLFIGKLFGELHHTP
jgi:hypothetical protein